MTNSEMLRIITESTEIIASGRESINKKLCLNIVGADVKKRELMVDYHVQAWVLNPADTLHGGILASIFDISMACVIFPFASGFAPTIELTVLYHRPVKSGETLDIRARIIETSKTLVHCEAEAYIRSTGKLASSAKGIYSMSVWTSDLDAAL